MAAAAAASLCAANQWLLALSSMSGCGFMSSVEDVE